MSTHEQERDALARLTLLERENRKLNREIAHLKNAIVQEKLASTTVLNQHKASTFLQRERERYLTLLLANSPSIILFLNPSHRVEFCTEYFIAKAGFRDAADVQGHTLTDVLARFLDAPELDALLEHTQKALAANAPLTFDVRFRFDAGNGAPGGRDERDEESAEHAEEYFAGLVAPMKDEQQLDNGIMLMFHDVTDLKRSREEALAASKAKSAFLSNMSHEIRTPMNAIIGMTSIGKQEATPARKDYAFEKIESASIHLLGVINDILDISKIESGKMELSPIVFRFSQMLDRVLSVSALKMRDKRQHFELVVDPAIPDLLLGDDQRLAQVITNILSNATKFTPDEGSISFTASLASLRGDTCVIHMAVRDSGIGMSRQEQSKLFNIFQQAQAGTARKYGGSGLGLAISKRILELMGGEIEVESEVGKGTCFSFTAPLGIPDADAAAEAAPAQGLSHGEDFSGKTILLADDVDINLEIAITLLEPTHITIDTARDGREAFEAFAAQPDRYDLILMDVQMPEIDGLQATAMIRALAAQGVPHAASVPIIAMTANVFKEDIQQCLDAGMNAHLGKPIVLRDVLDVLARYLA